MCNLSPTTGAGETAALTTTPEPMEVTAAKDARLLHPPEGQMLQPALPAFGAISLRPHAVHVVARGRCWW